MANINIFVQSGILIGACLISAILLPGCSPGNAPVDFSGKKIELDDDWRFAREDIAGAENPAYDHHSWRTVSLPHDFSAEHLSGDETPEKIGPFSTKSVGATSTGYTIGGTAWYRKNFVLQPGNAGKVATIHFDGVYMESDVWLNGVHLGFHPGGYTPFYYDLTPFLKPAGQTNVLAVKVRNEGRNSRWYSGSGIYRPVWITIKSPVHIAPWGIAIQPDIVNKSSAGITLQIKINNQKESDQNTTIRTKIVNAGGSVVAEMQTNDFPAKAGSSILKQALRLPEPSLWSPDHPVLYQAEVSVVADGKTVDRHQESFGVRSASFSPGEGFILNGEEFLLKGACIHHDNGLLGSAAFARAEERKVEIMKANGFNALRTSHNPPSAAFLEACDRLGMVVINEAFDMWEHPKNPQDYHLYFKEWHQRDLEGILLRDRNHPSVIMWSIGNEIYERADTAGVRIAKKLVEICHNADPTRPVTAAICGFWEYENRMWRESVPAFLYLDVAGYNYKWNEYEADHALFPDRVMVGTESFPMEAFENWQQVKEHPWVVGDFVWTGMDYLGETGIGHATTDTSAQGNVMTWPWYNAWCGDIDLCGFKKPQSYYRDVVWERSNLEMNVHAPMPEGTKEKISLWGWPNEMPSWTWPGSEGKILQVSVYANAQLVRLFLNGRLIAEKPVSAATRLTAKFEVPYAPGELKAVAIAGGRETGTKILQTSGDPFAIRLVADRTTIQATGNDLSYVTIEVIDDQGRLVPTAALPVRLTIKGEGVLEASGNAGPNDMKSFRNPVCTTWQGRALAIVRSVKKSGTVSLNAEAQNIKAAFVNIRSK